MPKKNKKMRFRVPLVDLSPGHGPKRKAKMRAEAKQ